MKRALCILIVALILVIAVPFSVLGTEAEDIVILYTNDVHTYIYDEVSNMLSYDSVSALKQEWLEKTDNVLLVDAGDHIQGTAYGAMDEGLSVIGFMNRAGYDIATLGNHEFDFTMTGTFAAMEKAQFPYVSCNFRYTKTGESVLDAYKIFDFGGTKVAVVGITTPDTITSTAPAYFQDENGNYIYGIDGGQDGKALYESVQSAIDSAKSEGAEYIIALGHLGVDLSSSPWTSREVIANTEGLTAFIDGHSHTVIESEKVNDKIGNSVILTQTGSYFGAVGLLTLKADGEVSARLITEYNNRDENVTEAIKAWVNKVDEQLGEKIADSEINFRIFDEDNNRIIRIAETNLGDFNADAFYYMLNEVDGIGCDVAIINGGGVRADADKGNWNYKTLKTVNPFGNVICVMEISGQQLLDALEWGAKMTTGEVGSPEFGGFLHTAGVTYEINTCVESSIVTRDDIWEAGPTDEYRVTNVKVYDKNSGTYLPLSLSKKYTIGGTNFTLRNLGDGFNMFQGAKLIKDYIMEDYMALACYASHFTDSDGDGYPEINTANSPMKAYDGYLLNYENIYGSDRIIINTEKTTPETGDDFNYALYVYIMLICLYATIMFKKKSYR